MAAIFKWIFLKESVRISIKISLKLVSKGTINNIPAWDQILAWHRPGDKPLSEPMMVDLLTHICVTPPQWVKLLIFYILHHKWYTNCSYYWANIFILLQISIEISFYIMKYLKHYIDDKNLRVDVCLAVSYIKHKQTYQMIKMQNRVHEILLILRVHSVNRSLTHWGRDKMAAVFQTTLWNAFSWMKML